MLPNVLKRPTEPYYWIILFPDAGQTFQILKISKVSFQKSRVARVEHKRANKKSPNKRKANRDFSEIAPRKA
jgi:hypothetical protein